MPKTSDTIVSWAKVFSQTNSLERSGAYNNWSEFLPWRTSKPPRHLIGFATDLRMILSEIDVEVRLAVDRRSYLPQATERNLHPMQLFSATKSMFRSLCSYFMVEVVPLRSSFWRAVPGAFHTWHNDSLGSDNYH